MYNLKHSDITGSIIKSFYKVYNSLGYGFLEKVYENALLIELRELGLKVEQQIGIHVFYRNQLVGEYFTDLVVEDVVIVELKTAVSISNAHEAQLINYLRATKFDVGLILNFGQTTEYKRKIFDIETTYSLSVLFDP